MNISMFKLIKRYFGIEKTERKILNRTFFWLIYAYILVRIVPLRWFSSLLGEFRVVKEEHDKENGFYLSDSQLKLIRILKRSIRRLKKKLPWKVKCFDEAIAGKKVLEKYGLKTMLFLGVAKETETNLKAHAWLKYDRVFITGERGYNNYTVVGFYSG